MKNNFYQIVVCGCKVTANRRQNKIKSELFVFIVEMQRNLFKVTANRRQNKIKRKLFVFIVEMQRNLSKVTANRRQYKIKSELFVDYLAIKHMTLTSITSL